MIKRSESNDSNMLQNSQQNFDNMLPFESISKSIVSNTKDIKHCNSDKLKNFTTPSKRKTNSIPNTPVKPKRQTRSGASLTAISCRLFDEDSNDITDSESLFDQYSEEDSLSDESADSYLEKINANNMYLNYIDYCRNGPSFEELKFRTMRPQSASDETDADRQFQFNRTLWSLFCKKFGGEAIAKYYLKLLDDIIWFVVLSLEKVEGKHRIDIIQRAIFAFLKFRYNESSAVIIQERIIPFFIKIFKEEEMEPQSFETCVSEAREFFDRYTTIKDSPIMKKMHRICMYILSLQIFENAGISFDNLGYSKMEASGLKKKFHDRSDFVFCLVDTVIFICERGIQIYKTGDVDTIFHSRGKYQEVYDASTELFNKSKLLSNPEAHGFTESEFRAKLDDTIEKLTSIKKHSYNLGDFEVKVFRSHLSSLEMLRDDLTTRSSAREVRKAPFSVQIFGDSGIGKTTITQIICSYFAKHENLPDGSEFVYTRNPAAKFWDGFVTSCHTVILDDIANEDPRLNDPKSLNEVIQIINNAAFCPDQAALEDKGRTPFKAKLVVGTTNVKNLNAYHYFSCPSAVQRRFPYIITPKVKPEYQNSRGMLDSEKAGMCDEVYPPLWTFSVEYVRPIPVSTGKYNASMETILTDVEILDFISWLHTAIEQFKQDQNAVSKSIERMKAVVLCTVCKMPSEYCDHEPIVENSDCSSEVDSSLECEYNSESSEQEPETEIFNILLGDEESEKSLSLEPQSLTFGISEVLLLMCVIYIAALKIQKSKIIVKFQKMADNFETIYNICTDGTFTERYKRLTLRMDKFMDLADSVDDWSAECHEYYLKFATRDFFGRAGRKMMAKIGTPKNAITISAVMGTIYMAYKYYTQLRPQALESSSIGKVPISVALQRENPWYNDEFELSSIVLSRQSTSAKSMEFTKFLEKIAENVAFVHITSYADKIVRTSRLVCIGGHIWLTNNHSLPNLSAGGWVDLKICRRNGVNLNHSFVIDEGDVVRLPDSEVCFLALRELPPMKKIYQYFLKDPLTGPFKGTYIVRSKTGDVKYIKTSNVKYKGVETIKHDKLKINCSAALYEGISDEQLCPGDCGSPLVIPTDYGYFIAGIHFLGGGVCGTDFCATFVSSKDLSDLYNKCPRYNVQSGDYSLLSSDSKSREIGPLHSKSVFRFFSEGTAVVYGSFVGFRPKPKSKVEHTPMNSFLSQHGYTVKFAKPEMSSWVPYNIAAQDLLSPVNKIASSVLRICAENYIKRISENIEKEYFERELFILDDFTAINGATVTYIDKIKRQTSAGNPWKKSKLHFMTPDLPQHGMQDPVKVDPEIMDRVNIILDKYSKGERAHPNFCAHLKDEPVSLKKASVGKTRVFTGAPFDWTIVVRKFYLTFTRVFQSNRFVFEGAPGTIAQSLEWEEIYQYLTKHGKNVLVAGDYKAFDKKMGAKEILAAFDIMIHFCELSGNYGVEEMIALQCIAEDTAYATTEFNGDLVEFYGSNPSGNPLTVIINSIVNSLRMRYVYFLLHPENDLSGFNDEVNLLTYGDDNIMNISPNIPWFNHTSISESFETLDIVYTMADKDAESIPFISISDATFLKRTWWMSPDLNCHVAPLDHESIEKMLMIWVRSKAIPEEAQGVAVISTALREYFYYGKQVFHEKTQLFKKLIAHLEWENWVEDSTFPTYKQLRDNFIESSKHCKDFEDYFPYYYDQKAFENRIKNKSKVTPNFI